MSYKKNHKKGQISIGAIIAIVFFINVIIFSFVMVYDIFEPKKIVEKSIKREAINILEDFKDYLTVTVYRSPVFITSADNYTDAKIELSFTLPIDADPNSLSILSSSDEVLVFDYDSGSGTLVWYSDLYSDETNKFYILYIVDTSLSKWDFELLFVNTTASENDMYNDKLKITLKSGGIEDIFYRLQRIEANPYDIDVVEHVDFSFSSPYNLTNTTLYGYANYTDANVTLIGNTGKAIIDTEDDMTFYLLDFKNIYNYSLGDNKMIAFCNGPEVNDTLNSSFAVIGDMDYTYYSENRTLEVSSSSIEIYVFTGNCSLAVPVLQAYNASYSTVVGVPESSTGLFEEKYSTFSAMSEEEIKEQFNISGNFFIYFENITGSILSIL